MKYQSVHLRIPVKTLEAVKMIAEVEKRSVTNQIVLYIEKGLPEEMLDESTRDISPALVGGEK